ncbi:class I SAM-dependent methyltransferase [Ensifer sp. ENS07]|jgi:SAM-dependent methyltransferase|uniref:Class I SAM-dependent methyltransferase n=1 Tax=Ensifer adhaerens TaxID=106592 RepID=A0A9Q8Y4R8_ENSAD|nr:MULTISPECIES: class I SAM-dependent methyltransferase [Ensifer]MBD9593710.1 class I SAM-dependent methyltransferase [Ensifer sp. ENS05]MBD9641069.1 class I SAM-dependent methyltransferase [Ensifer sp. ENS07]USJ22247.1 class I SAM-dependent methyltransferase [Ensifer adhaerens]UTV35562.1 class I SAM-dependent methyltransferase [Ensifer adhaerens]SDM82647.1 Methyltransferase domain-containing protein [Ensifer sp. YR511]
MSHNCRFCSTPLKTVVADLGSTPWSNSFLEPTKEAIARERSFPLKAMVCSECLLVQTTENVPADEIFTDGYAYLSSFSTSWLEHARRYAESMTERFALDDNSQVVEIASNDGYLLQYFVAKGIPALGIEPAANAARLAEERQVPTEVAFFGRETATELVKRGIRADLTAANNVLAHVPDIADFVGGFAILLKPDGVATFEFPHLLRLMEGVQFDTIYHEHYSYLSLAAVERIFESSGLKVFDVEELPTHGGSLRVYAQLRSGVRETTLELERLRATEALAGLMRMETYTAFDDRIAAVCKDFQNFLANAKAEGKIVAAYGAAAKGNTFLNVCGLSPSEIAFAVDRNDLKQGKLLPGTHIPVHAPTVIEDAKPDYLVILPWNLKTEIVADNEAIRDWGGRFVVAIPKLSVF